jgi:hypothetical protein
MLKGHYIVTKSFAFVDLGLDYKDQGFETRFAIVDDPSSDDGFWTEEEKEAIYANLYSIAINSGAEPIRNGTKVVSVNRCLDFNNPKSEPAKNDKAWIFNKGDHIFLTSRYEDKDGNVWEVGEDGITDLSFDQLHFLEDKGLIK